MNILFNKFTDGDICEYISDMSDRLSAVILDDDRLYIRIRDSVNNGWQYPIWQEDTYRSGFSSIEDLQNWLSKYNWQEASHDNISIDAVPDPFELIGFQKSDNGEYLFSEYQSDNDKITINILTGANGYTVDAAVNNRRLKHRRKSFSDVDSTANHIFKILESFDLDVIESVSMTKTSERSKVLSAINTKNLAQYLRRVKSSNVWAIYFNIDDDRSKNTGDLLMQFKGKNGGPGDVYIYYDVPIKVGKRLYTTSSKGHYFWQYIRDKYMYQKLTGDKKGKLKNAIS